MDRDDWARVIPGKGQVITTSSTAATSAAVGSQTYAVRLVASTGCFVDFGGTVATATTSAYIAPNTRGEIFKVQPGTTVSVIDAGTAGKLYLSELSQ